MNRILLFLSVLSLFVVTSCIQDDILEDFIQPELRISGSIDTLGVDSVFTFDVRYLNNVGQEESVDIDWTSSDESVVTVNNQGQIRGVAEGNAVITASFTNPDDNITASNMIDVNVGMAILPPVEEPLRMIDGTIKTTTFYELEGSFQFIEEENGVTLVIADDYIADTGLPGLFIYLSNNPNSIANALEIAPVTTFTGAHNYEIPDIGFEDYRFIVYFCKPFNVTVGDGTLEF